MVPPTVAYTFHYVLFTGYLCPDINPTPHMVAPNNLKEHRTEENVTFLCADGYILSGSKSAMCRYVAGDNMGSWDNKQPSCIG